MLQRERTQFGPLVGAFLARFFEGDFADGSHLKGTFFWLLAFLAAPGFLLPILIAFGWSQGTGPAGWSNPENWGWSLVAERLGVDALRGVSLTDKTLALAFTLAATGGIAAFTWNSLLPDRRDALVLGALPVRAATVVLSRMVALAAYVAMVAVGTNLLASLSIGVLLATGNTFAFALKGIGAHFIASVSASLFVFVAIIAVQGVLLAAGGARFFARVSPALQTILVALVVVDLLTLRVVSHAAGEAVGGTSGAESWVFGTPALWFLGLYEWVLGTDNALLVALARTAIVALGATAVLAVTAFPLAYRRLWWRASKLGSILACRDAHAWHGAWRRWCAANGNVAPPEEPRFRSTRQRPSRASRRPPARMTDREDCALSLFDHRLSNSIRRGGRSHAPIELR